MVARQALGQRGWVQRRCGGQAVGSLRPLAIRLPNLPSASAMAALQACYRALLAGTQPRGEALAAALQQELDPRVCLALYLPDGLSLLHAAVLGGVSGAIPPLLAAGAVRSLGERLEGFKGRGVAWGGGLAQPPSPRLPVSL